MIKKQIENLIKKSIKQKIDFIVEIPEQKTHGDYATNVALIKGRKNKENPMIIAKDIINKIKKDKASNKLFEKIEAIKPGFINFFLKPAYLQAQIKEILKAGKNFGRQKIGKGQTIIIDYSSPNIAKPMHVGHLRSTIIGQALYNIYKFLGYKTISDNHFGDWGTQFGIMIAACKKYKVNLKNITIKQMLDIYIRFNKEIKENPDLQEKAKEEFKKLENGNKENQKIWQILKEKSLKEFKKIYKLLKMKFDLTIGESFYQKDSKKIIKHALKKKIAIKNSDNSIIIPLEKFNLIPFLIQKADGTTLYSTRDLATIKHRVEKYKPEKIIYVVGNEQSFYFEQLFHSAELLNYISYNKLKHIKFGLVLDKNHKKLATRSGRVIKVEDLINKIIKLAKKVVKEKNPKTSKKEQEKIAKVVGIGTLKYNDLSQNRQTDIIFNWQKILSFRGNSGPYLQYSYARLQSILRKDKNLKNLKIRFLKEEEEIKILKELIKFPEIVEEVSKKFQINLLTDYLYNLASSANTFYEKFSVLKAEKDIKIARLALIKATTIVFKNGLSLLGIDVLEFI